MYFRVVQQSRDALAFQVVLDGDRVCLSSVEFRDQAAVQRAIEAVIASLREGVDASLQFEGDRYHFTLRDEDGALLARGIPHPSAAEADAALAELQRWADGVERFRLINLARPQRSGARPVETIQVAVRYDLEACTRARKPGLELLNRAVDGLFSAHVHGERGEVLLYLRGFATRFARDEQVESVLNAAADARRYDRREAEGRRYFIITARNGREIARSPWFTSEAECDAAIAQLVRLAPLEAREYIGGRTRRKVAESGYDLARRSTSGLPGFEVFKAGDGHHYFHLNDERGEALLFSHGYSTAKARDHGIRSLVKGATDPVCYRLAADELRFSITAVNSRELARSRLFGSHAALDRAIAFIRAEVVQFGREYGVRLWESSILELPHDPDELAQQALGGDDSSLSRLAPPPAVHHTDELARRALGGDDSSLSRLAPPPAVHPPGDSRPSLAPSSLLSPPARDSDDRAPSLDSQPPISPPTRDFGDQAPSLDPRSFISPPTHDSDAPAALDSRQSISPPAHDSNDRAPSLDPRSFISPPARDSDDPAPSREFAPRDAADFNPFDKNFSRDATALTSSPAPLAPSSAAGDTEPLSLPDLQLFDPSPRRSGRFDAAPHVDSATAPPTQESSPRASTPSSPGIEPSNQQSPGREQAPVELVASVERPLVEEAADDDSRHATPDASATYDSTRPPATGPFSAQELDDALAPLAALEFADSPAPSYEEPFAPMVGGFEDLGDRSHRPAPSNLAGEFAGASAPDDESASPASAPDAADASAGLESDAGSDSPDFTLRSTLAAGRDPDEPAPLELEAPAPPASEFDAADPSHHQAESTRDDSTSSTLSEPSSSTAPTSDIEPGGALSRAFSAPDAAERLVDESSHDPPREHSPVRTDLELGEPGPLQSSIATTDSPSAIDDSPPPADPSPHDGSPASTDDPSPWHISPAASTLRHESAAAASEPNWETAHDSLPFPATPPEYDPQEMPGDSLTSLSSLEAHDDDDDERQSSLALALSLASRGSFEPRDALPFPAAPPSFDLRDATVTARSGDSLTSLATLASHESGRFPADLEPGESLTALAVLEPADSSHAEHTRHTPLAEAGDSLASLAILETHDSGRFAAASRRPAARDSSGFLLAEPAESLTARPVFDPVQSAGSAPGARLQEPSEPLTGLAVRELSDSDDRSRVAPSRPPRPSLLLDSAESLTSMAILDPEPPQPAADRSAASTIVESTLAGPPPDPSMTSDSAHSTSDPPLVADSPLLPALEDAAPLYRLSAPPLPDTDDSLVSSVPIAAAVEATAPHGDESSAEGHGRAGESLTSEPAPRPLSHEPPPALAEDLAAAERGSGSFTTPTLDTRPPSISSADERPDGPPTISPASPSSPRGRSSGLLPPITNPYPRPFIPAGSIAAAVVAQRPGAANLTSASADSPAAITLPAIDPPASLQLAPLLATLNSASIAEPAPPPLPRGGDDAPALVPELDVLLRDTTSLAPRRREGSAPLLAARREPSSTHPVAALLTRREPSSAHPAPALVPALDALEFDSPTAGLRPRRSLPNLIPDPAAPALDRPIVDTPRRPPPDLIPDLTAPLAVDTPRRGSNLIPDPAAATLASPIVDTPRRGIPDLIPDPAAPALAGAIVDTPRRGIPDPAAPALASAIVDTPRRGLPDPAAPALATPTVDTPRRGSNLIPDPAAPALATPTVDTPRRGLPDLIPDPAAIVSALARTDLPRRGHESHVPKDISPSPPRPAAPPPQDLPTLVRMGLAVTQPAAVSARPTVPAPVNAAVPAPRFPTLRVITTSRDRWLWLGVVLAALAFLSAVAYSLSRRNKAAAEQAGDSSADPPAAIEPPPPAEPPPPPSIPEPAPEPAPLAAARLACPDESAGDPAIGLLVAPFTPVAGQPVRLLAATLTGDVTLGVHVLGGEQAPALALDARVRAGIPSAALAEWTPPAAGEYTLAITDAGAVRTCRKVHVHQDMLERPAFSPAGRVWSVERAWTAAEEALYSAWLRELFAAPRDGASSFARLDVLTGDPSRNLLHDALGLREDSPDAPGSLRLKPDGADLPYVLRAYWSWKRRLPFAYHKCDRGRDGVPPRCSEARTNLAPGPGYGGKAPELARVQRFFQYSLGWGVHAGNARTAHGDSASDFYPVRLDLRGLRPGAIYADPHGHVLFVVDVVAAREGQPGALLAVDGQGDGGLVRRRFWDGAFVWDPDPAHGGTGFKRFRPIVQRDGGLVLLGDATLAESPDLGDIWTGHAELAGQAFYDAVTAWVDPPPWDPSRVQREAVDALAELARARVDPVARAAERARGRRRPIAMPLGWQVFEGTGAWAVDSTPDRDLRLLIALDAVGRVAARVRERPDLFVRDGAAVSDPEAVARALEQELDELLRDPGRAITYTRSDGSPWTLGLRDLVDRRDALERAYNPNDCPELRWGAPAGSDELATCSLRAPAEQRARMEVYRGWFRQRRPPARGDRAP